MDLKGYIPKSLLHMAVGSYAAKEIETEYKLMSSSWRQG